MTARQCVVMMEHRTLQLEVFLQERESLDFARLVCQALTVRWQARNVLDVPNIRRLLYILVSVDFGLLVSPVG